MNCFQGVFSSATC